MFDEFSFLFKSPTTACPSNVSDYSPHLVFPVFDLPIFPNYTANSLPQMHDVYPTDLIGAQTVADNSSEIPLAGLVDNNQSLFTDDSIVASLVPQPADTHILNSMSHLVSSPTEVIHLATLLPGDFSS